MDVMPMQLWFNALVLGGMYALLALGLGVIWNTTRLFDFSYGAFYVVGAYAAYELFSRVAWPLPIVVLVAGFAATLLGLLVFGLVYHRLIRNEAGLLGFAIATLGVAIVMENATSYLYSPVIRTLDAPGISGLRTTVGAVRVSGIQVMIIAISVALLAAFFYFFKRTRMGLLLRAAATDWELAEIKGLNRLRISYLAFGIGYFLAGSSAVLIVLETRTMSPSMGHAVVVLAIVAVLLGGRGNTPAAAVGGFILALSIYLVSWHMGNQWAEPVVFLLFIAVLLIRPHGIFARKVSAVGR